MQNTTFNRELYNMTREYINKYNNEIKLINKNLIKFYLEFGIKSEQNIGCRKALKYKLISSIKDTFDLKKLIPSCDHIRQFITYDKKNIIISSPYEMKNENYTNKVNLHELSIFV